MVTVTAIRCGHTGHNKPLIDNARKKVKRLEKIWTEETLRTLRRAQMPEKGKCRLCQRQTQKIKDLTRSGTNEG